MFAEYASRDALGLADLVPRGEVFAGELLEVAVAEVERLNPALNAMARAFD